MTKSELFKNQKFVVIRLVCAALVFLFNAGVGYTQTYTSIGDVQYAVTGNLDIGVYSAPVFADTDGDGDLDLYVGKYDGRIKVFLNEGSGSFTYVGHLKVNGTDVNGGPYASLAFADLDGNGDPDLYLGGNDGKIQVYMNDGNGNFTSAGYLQAYGTAIDVGDKSAPAFADLDGDNDLDLYVGENSGVIFTYINDGTGAFTSGGNLQSGGAAIDVGDFAVPTFADVDGDNDMDLYVGRNSGSIAVYTNDGTGLLVSAGNMLAGGISIDVGTDSKLAFADIDGDGDLDLYAGEYDGVINIYNNDGTGAFTWLAYMTANNMEDDVDAGDQSAPVFADLDGDNDLDLYIGNYAGNIKIYNNDGTGKFSYVGNFQAGGATIDVGDAATPTFADIDGDNDLDLYVGNLNGEINVYTNDGTGFFTFFGKLQASGSTIDVGDFCVPTFADVDEDNDLDLYVGNGSGTIKVYTNDGTGLFASAGNLQAGGITIYLGNPAPTFADLDGDNDLDLYAGEYGKIKVYENNGSGNFSYAGFLQANGSDISIESYPKPVFVNLDGTCIPNLYIGHTYGRIRAYTGIDSSGPIITSTHSNQILGDGIVCSASLPDYTGNITAFDNCSVNLSIAQNPGSGTVISGSNNTVTLTVTDELGNPSVVSFNVAVADNENPVITSSHNDLIVNVNDNCTANLPDYRGTVIATDNCDANLTVTQSPVPGTVISGATNNLLLTITDDSGNSAEVTFNVAVEDHMNPDILSFHEDLILYTSSACEESLPDFTGEVEAWDNCDAAPVVTQNPVAGSIISGAVNIVALIVTDNSGNSSEVTFNVAVEDIINPVITSVHNDLTIGAGANCEINIPDYTIDVIATDNCDASLTITQSPVAGTIITGPSNIVMLSVLDDVGNTESVYFNISVVDNTNPVITSTHNNQIIYSGSGCDAVLPDYTSQVVATDNCSALPSVTQSPVAGSTISGLTNAITLTVTDDAGNSADVTFNIAVEDNTNPVISSTHEDQVIAASVACDAIVPDFTGNLIATDNCDATLAVIQSPVAGTSVSGATNIVTLTVTDDAGNSADITFNIAVEDNINPVISSTHEDQVIAASVACNAILPDYSVDVIATDNCDATLAVIQSPVAGTTISGATNTVTVTVTDDAGNSSDITFNIAVEDNANPVISCIGDQTVNADATFSYTINGTEFDPTATSDNCGILSVQNDFNNTSTLAGSQIAEGTQLITWTITDNAGNTEICTFEITVIAFVGIQNLSQQGFSVYPNPTSGIIKVEFADTYIKTVSVSDITGKVIIELNQVQNSGIIDLSGFESGIYVINIQTDYKIFTSKIIKE